MDENRTWETGGRDEYMEQEEKKAGEVMTEDERKLMEEDERLSREEEQFEAELAELMKEDPADKKGKKKRKKGKGPKREKGPRKPWSKKKKIIGAVIAVAAVVVVFKACGGKKDPGLMVSTTPLTKGTIQQELTISGPVSGTDSVDVVSNLHAEVTDIQVKEGDHVEEGQLLALIDDSDVKKELDMAQNAYDLAVST